jgi:hypothetical protein
VFPARYELNSYIVFRKRLVSKRLRNQANRICNIHVWNYKYKNVSTWSSSHTFWGQLGNQVFSSFGWQRFLESSISRIIQKKKTVYCLTDPHNHLYFITYLLALKKQAVSSPETRDVSKLRIFLHHISVLGKSTALALQPSWALALIGNSNLLSQYGDKWLASRFGRLTPWKQLCMIGGWGQYELNSLQESNFDSLIEQRVTLSTHWLNQRMHRYVNMQTNILLKLWTFQDWHNVWQCWPNRHV